MYSVMTKIQCVHLCLLSNISMKFVETGALVTEKFCGQKKAQTMFWGYSHSCRR